MRGGDTSEVLAHLDGGTMAHPYRYETRAAFAEGSAFIRVEAYRKRYQRLPLEDGTFGFRADGYGSADGVDFFARHVWPRLDLRGRTFARCEAKGAIGTAFCLQDGTTLIVSRTRAPELRKWIV